MTADGLTDPPRNACCSDAHQACETAVVNLSVLNREMFSEAEAARLLELPQSTLHYWLEGGERRGRLYKPIVGVEPPRAAPGRRDRAQAAPHVRLDPVRAR
jgi:hypothetical protein